jgi:hypothetical protein
MFDWKTVIELLRGATPAEKAKITAYLLAPGLVMALTVSILLGGSIGIDVAQPISVSELKSEISVAGEISKKAGFVVTIEPVAPEFRIELRAQASRILSSLDEQTIRANKNRLSIDGGGVSATPPFIGGNSPVTFVVDAPLGKEIQLPGRIERTEDLLLQSRRSVSIVASVLLACVFAFGMSSASIFPATNRDKHAAG